MTEAGPGPEIMRSRHQQVEIQPAGRLRVAVVLLLLAASMSQGPEACAGVMAALHAADTPVFDADLPVFFEDGAARIDLAVCVHHPQLQFERSASGDYVARAKVHLKLARKGEVALDLEQLFVVQAADEAAAVDPERFALFELSRPVEPGLWVVTVQVEDLQGTVGLAHERSEAHGVLSVPVPPPSGSYLSDVEFRWSLPDGSELPAPERLYGVRQDTLIVYAELNRVDQDRTAVAVRIEDPAFGYAQGDTLWVKGSGPRRAFRYRLALGSFPEGSYRLTMIPLREGAACRQGDFAVSWDIEGVADTGRNPALEIRLLFEGEERQRLLALPRSGQVAALNAFWARHDPTPGTRANELYERFLRRVDHAERFFSEQGTPGALSARGRVYIRFGPPAQKQIEVLPNDSRDLQEAVVKVHDPTQVDRAGWMAKTAIPLNSGGIEARQDLRRIAPGSAITQAAFELWIYDGVGDPLFADQAAGWTEGVDLRFLFVDALGTGVYRLETSNDPFHQN